MKRFSCFHKYDISRGNSSAVLCCIHEALVSPLWSNIIWRIASHRYGDLGGTLSSIYFNIYGALGNTLTYGEDEEGCFEAAVLY